MLRARHLGTASRQAASPTNVLSRAPVVGRARTHHSPTLSQSASARQQHAYQSCRHSLVVCGATSSGQDSVAVLTTTREPWPNVIEEYWTWNGHTIRYQRSKATKDLGKPPVVLVHGFGGNADHWRKNTGVLGELGHTAYAIDLLGYGFSDKPDPRTAPQNSIYCFPNWGKQLNDFIEQVVGSPSFIICNSVGGLAGLEASIARPDLVLGVQLLDISLRGLHVQRTPAWQRPLVAAFQRVLRETQLGQSFFASVATPKTVKNILQQAYGAKDTVTDELVECILKPGLQPGAVSVFLDFISYSGGPLPEDLIAATSRPVSIVWGEKDPWEDVNLGRKLFGHLPAVKEFITLPGVGHCPQDEAPQLVNPLIEQFCAKYSSK